MVDSIEARVRRLEDLEEIRMLTATYATHVNKGWNAEVVDLDKLPHVFTEDIRWVSAARSASGRTDVIQMLKESTARIDFAMHSFTNPMIEIIDDTATARWLLWVGVKTADVANQAFQSEDLTYLRTAAGWRIQSIALHFGAMMNR